MTTEQERIHSMMQDVAQGNQSGQGLVWDPETKSIRAVGPSSPNSNMHDPDTGMLEIKPCDMEHFAPAEEAPVITLSAESVERLREENTIRLSFRQLDDGEAWSDINAKHTPGSVLGTISAEQDEAPSFEQFGEPDDQVRIIACPPAPAAHNEGDSELPDDGEEPHSEAVEPAFSGDHSAKPNRPAPLQEWRLWGVVRQNDNWREADVQLVPVREDLFSRTRGLYETDVLANKCVFTAGLGSGGAPIVMELTKLGVMKHILMDHDRVEVANVVRHVAGLSDVGRFKTKVMAERILDKNPYAEIETIDQKITWDNQDMVRELVHKSDIVVCGVDDHEARVILNRLCIEEDKPLAVAGAFRRAYGGQVLFVQPGKTPCYQCFLETLPEKVHDQEISSDEHAERVAYSDRPVAIEPGLSNDIAPISQMVVKLVLQHLLKGQDSTLKSLDDDLVASWYLWLNRREAETDFEKLEPMGYQMCGFHILRWYGIAIDRNPTCAHCGDFTGHLAETENLDIESGDIESFANSGCA